MHCPPDNHYPSGLLTVDLDSLLSNWQRLRERLAAGAECGAVVKADAYGLGMAPVSRALKEAGCNSFFVVNVTEGVALRRALGWGPAIYVLQGTGVGQELLCVEHELVPVLVSLPAVERWLAFCDAGGLPVEQRRSVLKVNTGMNRLGIELSELRALLSEDGILQRLGCRLIMSHLACADEPEHPLSQAQLDNFRLAVTLARQQLPSVRASLANSAGVLAGEQWHFDLVRPGIALYGANATGLPEHRMNTVAKLELPVIQKRGIRVGDAVGYGASFVSDRERQTAALAGGYGDGIFRNLGNKGRAWFGAPLPILGRVSMDSIVIDLTELPAAQQPAEGDLVEVLGPMVDVDAVAQAAGTVAYEVLTRLGNRYARRYLLNGAVQKSPVFTDKRPQQPSNGEDCE